MTLAQESKANFEAFYAAWIAQAGINANALHRDDRYLASYRRVAAFQALKIDLVMPTFTEQSAAFFHEAHNDALVSHVSASYGAWRSSLKSLRSVIENSLAGLYYADHPIELANWRRGKKRTSFSELIKYFEDHPHLEQISPEVSGLTRIKSEYATLSKAVHASAVSFRMTDDVSQVLLWDTKKERVGKWSAREKEVIAGVSQLIIALFAEELRGARRSQLREVLGYVFSGTLRSLIKKELGVNITVPV